MFEITDMAMIVQAVSLAVALASGVAALIYFVRKPRETEDYQTIDETETIGSPSPSSLEQPSNMVPIMVYVPKSTLNEILRSALVMRFTPPPPKSKPRELFRRVGESE